MTELSKKLGMQPVEVWRRISKLLDAGILEQCKVDHVGNLEKKAYRATALKYVPMSSIDFEPKNKDLKEAFKSYLEIQREGMKDLASSNEIPDSESIDTIECGVHSDLKSFCHVMLSEKTHAVIGRLEKQLTT